MTAEEVLAKLDKTLDLEELGLINQGLFPVTGELAQRYNAVLKHVFGLDCDADSFRIDKRGLSPELCTYFKQRYPGKFEYGENYLNIGSANRFMIVLSPDQASSRLIARQTSYEDGLYDMIYKSARHTIEDVTASEALFGELDNGITFYRNAHDLMQLRAIELTLDTIQGTVKSTLELKALSTGLANGDNALDNDYIAKMREIVKRVGNVRERAISDVFPIKKEVHCFYVEFFNGVHCLRNFKNKDDLSAIFIYNGQNVEEDFGEEVMSIEITDPRLMDFLERYKFVGRNYDLIPARLVQMEDQALLAKGIDVIPLQGFERKRKLLEFARDLPESYYTLQEMQKVREHSSKERLKTMFDNLDFATRLKIYEPLCKEDIVGHIIAELDPCDIVRLHNFNQRKFRRDYQKMTDVQKRYTAFTILNNCKEGKA